MSSTTNEFDVIAMLSACRTIDGICSVVVASHSQSAGSQLSTGWDGQLAGI